jgi:hypothetical protein
VAFTWKTSDLSRIEWLDYRGGVPRTRVLLPNASLEFPSRRVFVECEAGPLSSARSNEDGAVLAKIAQYHRLITGRAPVAGAQMPQTFFASIFRDGRAPELIFLVPSERRRAHLDELFAREKVSTSAPLRIRVGTPVELAQALGSAGAAKSDHPRTAKGAVLRASGIRTLRSFFTAVVLPVKQARAAARAAGTAVPPYPAGTDDVHRLLVALEGGTTDEPSR